MQQSGCDPLAGGFFQPSCGKHVKIGRVKGACCTARLGKRRVGDKFGMLFPLEPMFADLAVVMRGSGLRMGCSVPIQQ